MRRHRGCHPHRRGRRRGCRGRPRRLFWRVYLYGLVLLAAVAAAVGVVGALTSRGPYWDGAERIGRYLDQELTPLLDRPAALSAELERLHATFDIDLAVYEPSGARLAGAGAELPGPLDDVPAELTVRRRGGAHEYSLPLAGGRAYVIGRTRWEGPAGSRFLLAMAAVLSVLALVSLPLARGLVRPIERITAAARALGAGELSARTGITRRDEVGDLARAFDDMAGRLEQLVQNEKELLANVSHELRTPLARIRVALELVEEGAAGGEAVSDHLRGIGGDLRELEHLVDQVLMTARLDLGARREGGLPLERAPVVPSELVLEAAERFAARHPAHRLVTRVQPELMEIEGDAALLRRVLDNLLDNAAKYAPAEAGPIEIEASSEGGDAPVVVSVRDGGPGVDEADLPRLFEPFFRADKSRERGTGGVGLGLALCRRIVTAHGGRIEALPAEFSGLEVRFSLPSAGPVRAPRVAR